ncbi:hypothetical protein GCM10009085_35020 [Pseudomonas avellanae]|nr:hypothetical protein GCM10009085_35020 [Pseudomonas avellanae]
MPPRCRAVEKETQSVDTSVTQLCDSVSFRLDLSHLFAPRRLTLKDQSKQNPGSVSGPISSGSFVLTLIRGSPDQCQDSAVTYVALCVVSAIVIKSTFVYVQ